MAARFCPKCGKEVASTARFCPNCAAPLTPTVAPTIPPGSVPPPAPIEAAATNTRRLLMPALIAAVIVLAIIISVLAAKLSHPVVTADTQPVAAPPLTNAPSAPVAAPPVTNAPSTPVAAPPVTNAPSTPPPGLPADVAAYLKFLQGVENRRTALANDASGATAMLQTARQMQANSSDPEQQANTAPNNVNNISQGYAAYTAKWTALIRDFHSAQPPQPCMLLANQYSTYLTGYADTISKLQVALLNGDLSAAMGMQGAEQKIDAEGLQADDQLTQLCARYNAPKPFSIQPEGAAPSVLGP